MAELFLGVPIFPGQSELNQVDTIFKIMGTPAKEQWREGYELAAKRGFTFTEHKKIPLKFLFEDVSIDCLDILDSMFQINPQNRPTAHHILEEPYFKRCSLKNAGARMTQGNFGFGITSSPSDQPKIRKIKNNNRLMSEEKDQKSKDMIAPQGFLEARRSSLQGQTKVT